MVDNLEGQFISKPLASQIMAFYGIYDWPSTQPPSKRCYSLYDHQNRYSKPQELLETLASFGDFDASKLDFEDVRADFRVHNSVYEKAVRLFDNVGIFGFFAATYGFMTLGSGTASDMSLGGAVGTLLGKYYSQGHHPADCNGSIEEYLKLNWAGLIADGAVKNKPAFVINNTVRGIPSPKQQGYNGP